MISVFVIVARKRFLYLFVGWLWYAITIVPVIGIIQIGMFGSLLTSDRYTYLPSIGIAIMVSWEIPLLFKNDFTCRTILFPAGIATLAVLAVLTWQQCSYWRNSFELAEYYLQVTPHNKTAHSLAYNLRGRANFEMERYQQALEEFNEVVRLIPKCAECYYNRANAYNGRDQLSHAIEVYYEAIRLMPDFVHAYYFRGIAYKKLGMNRCAIEDYNQATRLELLQRPQQ
jgi:tetratricopeptide (TPR) repeat protein